MKRTFKTLTIMVLCLCMGISLANAQQRRPVDSKHPMWLVHIDVWNQADPQKIIDLIPDDVKPFVCMNLSLSCAYDKELDMHQRPQNAIRTYKSWASVCQMNNMWFTLQPASGGHTHILENDLETFEYFFKAYPNFLGWNYAEQFWGFNESGDKYSSSDVDRIALFAKLIPMHHKYGGFLTISFCGNVWSHPLNPVGMMKRDANLLQACMDYPEAIVWLYKYTTSSCFYNNESVSFGPFVSGLTRNYGVRYDNCGWNGATSDLMGDGACKYPTAAGIGTVMEQTCQNGGAIWDGPELIWTEDFQNLSNTTVSNYTQRNWGRYKGFDNAWIDMFRKIIDGTMYIPTQQEVIDKTKIILVNNVTSGSDEDMYATWGDLYDGIYKQTDPFNRDNGQWMNNYWYLKSTGRYGTIPMTPRITDMSKNIPNKIAKATRTSKWPNQAAKVNMFNAAYPEVSKGDLFVSRFKNQLVTYTPYTYLNSKKTASANIPLQYNTCKSLDLTWGKLSSALVKEYADSITFYLNNYRSDTITRQKDIIVVNGAVTEPTFTVKRRQQATLTTPVPTWDPITGTYSITIEHNGPIDLVIKCQGEETERSTDYVNSLPLESPKQPENFYGTLIIEAEDMNFKSVKESVNNAYYSAYKMIRGHSGNGFVVMGTSTAGALTKTFNVKKGGQYKVALRYSNQAKESTLRINFNGTTGTNISKKLLKTNESEWRKDTVTTTLLEGSNTLTIYNTSGIDFKLDQVILTPADEEMEQFAVTVHEAENGIVTADFTEAEEGTLVTLSVKADKGFSLDTLNVIHGKVVPTRNVDGTYSFIMPDDNVTIAPVFRDNTIVYNLDFTSVESGTFPAGWRASEDTEGNMHMYPNSYTSGSRTFKGFTGTYSKGLYWKVKNCEYGNQADYRLTLEPGDYTLTYAMAAWKGTPSCKAQILKTTGTILKQESTYSTATPNANGSMAANLSSAVVRKLNFTVTTKGNYVINFLNNGTGFSEFLLLACRINIIPRTIEGDVNEDGVVDVKDINAIITFMSTSSYDKAADVNHDGTVDVKDINAVITIMSK